MNNERAVVVVLDTTLMLQKIENCPTVELFDPDWLIAMGLGMWDHAQSYPDAHDDAVQWLMYRVPSYTRYNDAVCQMAGIRGTNYDNALRQMCECVAVMVMELVECIEAQYSSVLGSFIYEGGWTISGLSFFGDCVAMRYDRTYIKQLLSAQESLLSRLDQLYRPPQPVAGYRS